MSERISVYESGQLSPSFTTVAEEEKFCFCSGKSPGPKGVDIKVRVKQTIISAAVNFLRVPERKMS